MRSRRKRSATRIKGRIRNHRTIGNVTATINITVATIHKKLLPPKIVAFVADISRVHQNHQRANYLFPSCRGNASSSHWMFLYARKR